MTALPDRDVVFVRFQNEGTSHSCLPYFIAIDEHSKSVGQLHAVALAVLLLLFLCCCVLLWHVLMYSALPCHMFIWGLGLDQQGNLGHSQA